MFKENLMVGIAYILPTIYKILFIIRREDK